MATTTVQRAPTGSRWLLCAVLLTASVVALAIAFFVWPSDALIAVSTVVLRLRGFESRNAQLGTYRVHYFVGGSGQPLVLVHGLGGRAVNFALLMPALARRHRVYALDLLGYGDSDRPDLDYSVTLETGILQQFLDSQGLTRTDLVGWSMGGWISLTFTTQSPERVRRLILLDSAGMKFTPSFDLGLLTPSSMADMRQLAKLLTPRSAHAPEFVLRDLLRYLRNEAPVIQRTVAHMETGGEFMDGNLDAVTMPVLIVWGKEDALTPLAIGAEMHRQMPQSILKVLDGCGHIAPVECHDRVLREMQRFLGAH